MDYTVQFPKHAALKSIPPATTVEPWLEAPSCFKKMVGLFLFEVVKVVVSLCCLTDASGFQNGHMQTAPSSPDFQKENTPLAM
jgi:hypothetical protein